MMKPKIQIISIAFLLIVSETTFSQENLIDYFGQTPPGKTITRFSPDQISIPTRADLYVTFNPEGDEMLFGIYNNGNVIKSAKRQDGEWQALTDYNLFPDYMPRYSPVKGILYLSGSGLSYSLKSGSVWSEAIEIDIINSSLDPQFPSATLDSVLYFKHDAERNMIYYSKFNGTNHETPVALPYPINYNSNFEPNDPCISPQGDYLLMMNEGTGIWHVSFKKENDQWTYPKSLLNYTNNIPYLGLFPVISPDGKYIFASNWSANIDIFWISSDIIDEVKMMVFAPEVADRIPDMNISTDSTLNYTIPENTFKCEYGAENLKHTARLENDSALPAGLTFNTKTLLGKPTETGEFNIKITATNRDTVSVSDVFKLTIEQGFTATKNTVKKEVFVYPNPAHNKICIESANYDISNSYYKIFDITGATLLEGYLGSNSIDISELKTGTYMLQLKTKTVLITKKIVVE